MASSHHVTLVSFELGWRERICSRKDEEDKSRQDKMKSTKYCLSLA